MSFKKLAGDMLKGAAFVRLSVVGKPDDGKTVDGFHVDGKAHANK